MSLAAELQQILDDQAPSWSDLLLQLRLPDELRLDEARLAMAPTQLERTPGTRDLFTFRVSHQHGYGCHDALAVACLAKLDDRMIPGFLELTRVLHDVRPNMTQGPVI